MTGGSTSRGRDDLTSSGRGGLGNMRHSSESRERPIDGPDDFSSTRGREPAVVITEVRSTGRGGSGNFRSPSRDTTEDRDVRSPSELERIRAHEARGKEAVFSTGRGADIATAGAVGHELEWAGARPPPGALERSRRRGNIVPGPAPPYERGRAPAIE
ncbi:hypothetical protein B0H11DRAFT_2206461 [Mycena galericulata]|nr:hypothetical protein B0H11DRAFT_2206461 [Mycena galericulata]